MMDQGLLIGADGAKEPSGLYHVSHLVSRPVYPCLELFEHTPLLDACDCLFPLQPLAN